MNFKLPVLAVGTLLICGMPVHAEKMAVSSSAISADVIAEAERAAKAIMALDVKKLRQEEKQNKGIAPITPPPVQAQVQTPVPPPAPVALPPQVVPEPVMTGGKPITPAPAPKIDPDAIKEIGKIEEVSKPDEVAPGKTVRDMDYRGHDPYGRDLTAEKPLVGDEVELKYGKLLFHGPASKPYVAFTFDDGPGLNTKDILKILAYHRAKATFFLLGNSLEIFPNTAKAIAASGHLLGNHTYSHLNFNKVPEDGRLHKLQDEIIKTYIQIQLITGYKTHFLRIPYGVSKKWVLQGSVPTKHFMINWTYGVDTLLEKSKEEMLKEYMANLKPGAVFLFHDGGNRKPKTIWVVDRLLDECRRRGLKAVTLDRMLDVDIKKYPRPHYVTPISPSRN